MSNLLAATYPQINNAPPLSGLDVVVGSAVSVILTGVGLLFLIMLIIAGFQYLSAGSNKEAVQKARNALSMALVGLVLSVVVWTGLLMIGTFFGVNLGTFTICITPGC